MKKILFLFAATAMLISCDPKKPGGEEGTKTDPGTIATADLITYFSFDENFNDAKGLTPKGETTSTIDPAGRRGGCYLGATDGGLIYELPATHAIHSLQSFSFSMWLKLDPNTTTTLSTAPHDPEQMIFQVDAEPDLDWIWGNFFFLQHRNFVEDPTAWESTHAPMDCYFWKDDAVDSAGNPGWRGQRGDGWALDLSSPVWQHVICTYNATSSEFHAYLNGSHVTGFLRSPNRDTTVYAGVNRYQSDPLAGGQPLGALKFKDAKNFVLGAWAAKIKEQALLTDNWAASFRGRLDEFRIYKRALTATEAKDLYDAELSQVEE